jgi:hypothetical protein
MHTAEIFRQRREEPGLYKNRNGRARLCPVISFQTSETKRGENCRQHNDDYLINHKVFHSMAGVIKSLILIKSSATAKTMIGMKIRIAFSQIRQITF